MKSLRRMVRYLRPYQLIVILGLSMVVLPTAMELVTPRMLQYIIDQGIRAQSQSVVIRGALLMLGAAVIGALATLAQGYCRAYLSQGIAFDMRNELFAHIQSLSFANLDQLQTGQLMTRISSDVDTVRMFSSAGLALLLRALGMIIGSVIMLLVTDWQLTLIVFVLLALAGILLRTIMRIAQPLFYIVQQKLAGLNTIVQENLAGVQVVKAYVRERYEIDRFDRSSRDYMDQNIRVGRLMAMALPTLTVITNVGAVLIIWQGGLSTIGGRLSVGELVAFNNYLLIGMAPLMLLSNMLMMISRAEASAQRYFEVLDTPPRIQTAATPYRPQADQQPHKRVMHGRIVFDKVSFAYDAGGRERGAEREANGARPGALSRPASSIGAHNGQHSNGRNGQGANGYAVEGANGAANGAGHNLLDGASLSAADLDLYGIGREEVLCEVSFTVEPGQQVALLGATGSGKSTLVNLVPRFYDVTDGAIRIDDVDVREWAPDLLRSQIGMVLQQNTLFSGTVRDNISYGRPDATLEEVMAAAKAAQAHDFISRMPDSYDSPVESRGANLSGGQKQRIAIARALLIDPAILILDDSTSALDFETEIKLQAELEQLMVGRTTLIVAQRINSVLKADQILVLDEGKIIARGTHQALLQSSPIYQEIYQSQIGEGATTVHMNGAGSKQMGALL
ncbi:MAG: ABC transporter ATP-binding protein [Caldilineaceae bacterium]